MSTPTQLLFFKADATSSHDQATPALRRKIDWTGDIREHISTAARDSTLPDGRYKCAAIPVGSPGYGQLRNVTISTPPVPTRVVEVA